MYLHVHVYGIMQKVNRVHMWLCEEFHKVYKKLIPVNKTVFIIDLVWFTWLNVNW